MALATCVVLSLGLVWTAPALAVQYGISDLGQFDFVAGLDINNYGQVVAVAGIVGQFELFSSLWSPDSANSIAGSWVDLGSVGGCYCHSSINDQGDVLIMASGSPSRLWKPTTPNGTTGSTVNVNQLLGADPNSSAFVNDINNHGQFIGEHRPMGEGRFRAFVWTPNVPGGVSGSHAYLDPSEQFDYVATVAINDRGQAVGWQGRNLPLAEEAMLWSPTIPNGQTGAMTGLGTLDGRQFSVGGNINAVGQVIGYSSNLSGVGLSMFLWTPDTLNGTTGTMIDLGIPSPCLGNTCGINNRGDVVALNFFYSQKAGVVDLHTLIDPHSGWEIIEAMAINDWGQIAGTGTYNGQQRAFLLTPTNLLPGDYSADGIVDAADFTIWRDNLGNGAALPNDDTPGVGQDDYDRWKANFSQTSGSGGTSTSVPEPTAARLLIPTSFLAMLRHRRGRAPLNS